MFLERPCAGGVATLGEPGVELTILMPCLNEAETLAACVGEAAAALAAAGRRGRGDGRRQWQHRRVAGTGAGRRGAGGRGRRPWLRQRAGRRHRRRARPVRADRRRRRLLRLRRVAEVPGATAWWRGSGHGLPPAGRRGADPARGHAVDAPLDRQPDPERPWPPVLHRIESTTSIAACAPSGATPSWGWGCNARAWSSPRRWWCGRASPAWRWPRCR